MGILKKKKKRVSSNKATWSFGGWKLGGWNLKRKADLPRHNVKKRKPSK